MQSPSSPDLTEPEHLLVPSSTKRATTTGPRRRTQTNNNDAATMEFKTAAGMPQSIRRIQTALKHASPARPILELLLCRRPIWPAQSPSCSTDPASSLASPTPIRTVTSSSFLHLLALTARR